MVQDQFPRYSERYFYLSPLYSRGGWYFRTRGGKSIGPYFDKQQALLAAEEFAAECRQQGKFGGRQARAAFRSASVTGKAGGRGDNR